MATIMTKRGQLDNVVTYEHICDTVADMANINPSYVTLGSVCIVIKGENDDLEVYMADSKKEWKIISSSSGESGSISSSGIHICAQDEYDSVTGMPTIEDPLSNTFYLTPGGSETNDLYNEWIWLEDDEEWEKFGSATTAISQPDWNQSNSSADDFIKNKPAIRQQANGGGILENEATSASGSYSHAEGGGTRSTGMGSHAEGGGTTASGSYSHAEGGGTNASSEGAHAEGTGTTASALASHSEGSGTTASGQSSHSEGDGTTASGQMSHAEGGGTNASGQGSHAEGGNTVASGYYSHVEGISTTANHMAQHVFGTHNVPDNSTESSGARGNYVEIVGNGLDTNRRSNARTLDWNGNEEVAGDVIAYGCGGANPISLANLNNQMGAKASTDMVLGAYPTNTAMGNVVEISDGAKDLPVEDFIIDIKPIFYGIGTPSPENVMPFRGWNEIRIGVCDYKFPNSGSDQDVNFKGVHFVVTENMSHFRIVGTANEAISTVVMSFANNLKQDTYYMYNIPVGYKNMWAFSTSGDAVSNANGITAIPNTSNRVFIYPRLSTGDKIDADFYPIVSDKPPIIVHFPLEVGTVYGGTFDALSGTLKVYPYYESYNGETLVGPWISSMDVYTEGAMPTIGAQVVDMGATPTIYQLDPVDIRTFKGTNYICADTGDISVTYRADPTLYNGTIKDVQVNGVSVVSNGVANVPIATNSVLGAVKVNQYQGLQVLSDGSLGINSASDVLVKAGTVNNYPLTPGRQHAAAFYGLAKVAGDTTQSQSSNAVGQYTESAKAAIKDMLGITEGMNIVTVSGTAPTINAASNTQYLCGEVLSLNFTPSATGICDVIFTSGSTQTVLTMPATVKMPEWFEVEANKIYEISITNGVYGAVMVWENA